MQLKNDLTKDGKVQSVAGKAKWTVRWDEGPLKGTVVAQSFKSLRLWQVDLSAFDAGEAGGSDSSEAPAKPGAATAARRRAQRNRLLRSTIPSASGSSRSTPRPSRGRQSRYVHSSACTHFALLGLR